MEDPRMEASTTGLPKTCAPCRGPGAVSPCPVNAPKAASPVSAKSRQPRCGPVRGGVADGHAQNRRQRGLSAGGVADFPDSTWGGPVTAPKSRKADCPSQIRPAQPGDEGDWQAKRHRPRCAPISPALSPLTSQICLPSRVPATPLKFGPALNSIGELAKTGKAKTEAAGAGRRPAGKAKTVPAGAGRRPAGKAKTVPAGAGRRRAF